MTRADLIKSELIWRRILGYPPGAVRLIDWTPERRKVPHSPDNSKGAEQMPMTDAEALRKSLEEERRSTLEAIAERRRRDDKERSDAKRNRHRQALAAQCLDGAAALYVAQFYRPKKAVAPLEAVASVALELADEIIRQSEKEPSK